MSNISLFQFFHWYTKPEESLWVFAGSEAPKLARMGITHVWLPPAYKSANGAAEPGYAVYDLYDLGEFDQKGSVRTKYGTREEYLACIKSFQENNIQVIADIVLNHKLGADEKEMFPARLVDSENRMNVAEHEEVIEAWTKFSFPARNGKYSAYVWDWHSFTGVTTEDGKIYLIQNEHANNQWDEVLEDELGNYDYLMGADIEFRNSSVVDELTHWGEWYVETTNVDGFRLDAVKHITPAFYNRWLEHLDQRFQKNFLCIGEYWRSDPAPLLKYVDATAGRVQLFDVPLHFNFHRASNAENNFDMSTIFHNTLITQAPTHAVTFVDNHDTQPLQSLQSPVEAWFKPLAYALILLRIDGIPSVFYPAYYGVEYEDTKDGADIHVKLDAVPGLEVMIKARQLLAYGEQRDYFDHANTIGWTREGNDEMEHSGLAVVLTNGSAGDKFMEIGVKHAGKLFIDITGGCTDKIQIGDDGKAKFLVADRTVSVWIAEDALTKLKDHE